MPPGVTGPFTPPPSELTTLRPSSHSGLSRKHNGKWASHLSACDAEALWPASGQRECLSAVLTDRTAPHHGQHTLSLRDLGALTSLQPSFWSLSFSPSAPQFSSLRPRACSLAFLASPMRSLLRLASGALHLPTLLHGSPLPCPTTLSSTIPLLHVSECHSLKKTRFQSPLGPPSCLKVLISSLVTPLLPFGQRHYLRVSSPQELWRIAPLLRVM